MSQQSVLSTDESRLRCLLDSLNTIICNTHYWESYDMMVDPEIIVLEDKKVKKFLDENLQIFLSNKEWFLYQTFFEGKPFAFSAILRSIEPFLDEQARLAIIPFFSANEQKRIEYLNDHYEVTKGYGIIDRALAQIAPLLS